MTDRVYRLDSGFELRLEDVYSYFEGYEPPDGVEEIELERRGNKLIVGAIGIDGSGTSKYSPTARLKADVTERRLYETDEGWSRTPPEKSRAGSPQDRSSEEPESKLVEFACFKGDRDTVLQNTDLQYQMFEVLCDLAKHADRGDLTAVVAVDGKLSATRIVDGEERTAFVEVVEEKQRSPDNTSDWRNNNLISD